MGKQHPSIQPVDTLTEQEYRVFRKSILTAHFPVLAVPTPPQDAASVTPARGRDLDITARPKSAISAVSLAESLTWGSDPEDVDISIIPMETLCDMVRQVFGLSKSRSKQYERVIYEPYGKKSDAKALSKIHVLLWDDE